MDVDGTLYRQSKVRWRMALELLTAPAVSDSLKEGINVIQTIWTFRKVREELRGWEAEGGVLDEEQYRLTADRLKSSTEDVQRIVSTWIYQRPLRHLHNARYPGLVDFLERASEHALILGVFSDYPAEEKLSALQIRRYFESVTCATDRAINRFKPHAAGFERFCQQHELRPGEVLYVGDRYDVDARGAENAGMRCAIVSTKVPHGAAAGCTFVVSSYQELSDKLLPAV